MTKSFAQSIAQFLEREHPDLIVSEMSKVKRKGKVFIDWSQRRGDTLVLPFMNDGASAAASS